MRKAAIILFLLLVCLVGFSEPEALGQQPQHCDDNNPLAIRFEGFDGILIEPVMMDALQEALCAKDFAVFIGEEFTISHQRIDVDVAHGHVIQLFTPRGEELMGDYGDTPVKALKNVIDKLRSARDHGIVAGRLCQFSSPCPYLSTP